MSDLKPNEQAAALIWLVRKYPDMLKRLESLAAVKRQETLTPCRH